MEGELVAIFLYQKQKEILTRYNRTILTATKNWLISKIEGHGSTTEPARPWITESTTTDTIFSYYTFDCTMSSVPVTTHN